MKFDGFNFHPHVTAGIAAAGYATPTPIQAQAIPPILAGRDLMGLAQTGTGKTAAFVLPMLQRLMQDHRRQVRALIVAPTRELAEQIHASIGQLGRQTPVRSAAVYGGVGMTPQLRQFSRGVEIVVACPGRLLDHLGRGNVDLSHVEMLVLDEADQMFDMGFLPDVRRILQHLPRQRQTLLFSATMPQAIRRLAGDLLRDPITIQVGKTAPAETVRHVFFPVQPHLKTPMLLELLQRTETASVLVFARTKHRARRLGEQLAHAGYRAASLQGNLSQNRRQAAMDGFRDGTFQILVATDIAARGIDVTRVSHVINYDISDTAEAYIHRIGRTGRAEQSGEAFTLVTRDDGEVARAIERLLGNRLQRRTLDGFDTRAPAPQPETEVAPALRAASRGRNAARSRGAAYRSPAALGASPMLGDRRRPAGRGQ
jgi:ATP-dependent RNA helicase RhlE